MSYSEIINITCCEIRQAILGGIHLAFKFAELIS